MSKYHHAAHTLDPNVEIPDTDEVMPSAGHDEPMTEEVKEASDEFREQAKADVEAQAERDAEWAERDPKPKPSELLAESGREPAPATARAPTRPTSGHAAARIRWREPAARRHRAGRAGLGRRRQGPRAVRRSTPSGPGRTARRSSPSWRSGGVMGAYHEAAFTLDPTVQIPEDAAPAIGVEEFGTGEQIKQASDDQLVARSPGAVRS